MIAVCLPSTEAQGHAQRPDPEIKYGWEKVPLFALAARSCYGLFTPRPNALIFLPSLPFLSKMRQRIGKKFFF
jgi:hypothetical protein